MLTLFELPLVGFIGGVGPPGVMLEELRGGWEEECAWMLLSLLCLPNVGARFVSYVVDKMVLSKNFFPKLQGPMITIVLFSFVLTHSFSSLFDGGDEGTNVEDEDAK
jgi:hypothetical protein